jgi:hypothetical protein
MILRTILAAAALLFAVPSAHAALDVGDLICETTTTTGTGTVNLGGAVTNYLTFVSQIASGNTVPYHIRASDGKLETGIGTFTDGAPDTLTRTADWSSDGSGAELTLPAGTHNVCLGPISGSIVHKTGTPVATQIALWNSSYLVEGTDALSFDGNTMYIYRVSDGTAGGSMSAGLDSNTLAANDIPFRFFAFVTGDDDEPNIGLIEIAVADATNDAEAGRIDFRVCTGDDGSLSGCPTLLTFGTSFLSTAADYGAVFGHSVELDTFESTAGTDITPGFQILGDGGPSSSQAMARFTAADSGVFLWGAHSRGTTVGDYTAVNGNSIFLEIIGLGSDGTDFEPGAFIRMEVDEDASVTGDDMPGQITFGVTLDGAATPTQRLMLKNNGGLIIGNGDTGPGLEDLSIEGGDIEFGNAGTVGTDTTLSRSSAANLSIEGSVVEKAGTQMIYVPAAAMISRATSGADCSATLDSGASDITIRVCNFDTAADEWAMFTLSMPPRWNEGTVTAEYVWSTTGASTPGETVSIDISCVAISNDDPLNATLGTPINVDDTMLSADGDSHLSPASTAVTCGGTPAANDTVVFAVMRDISDDNVAADMSLLGVRLFITTDTANDG